MRAWVMRKEEPQSLFTPDEPISESESLIAEKSPSHYQYKGKYIMTSVKSGLMIIDQHRAHLRILYENFMEQLNQRINSSQKVLFPEMVQILQQVLSCLTKSFQNRKNRF